MPTPDEIIKALNLQPLPVEGGLFRQTYAADEQIAPAALPARYRGPRPFGVAIYYLLTSDPDSFSALHRLPTDEIWHFYLGDPVEMLLLPPGGRGETVVLGPDILHGQQVQFVVRREVWMGARLLRGGRYALMGTTMAPGWDDADYTGGRRDELAKQYPQWAGLIGELTRG